MSWRSEAWRAAIHRLPEWCVPAMVTAVVGALLFGFQAELRQQSRDRARGMALAELHLAGGLYEQALGNYWFAAPRTTRRLPDSLAQLLDDRRGGAVRHHLSSPIEDPLSGRTDWDVLRGPTGGITGVRSHCAIEPRGCVVSGVAAAMEFIYRPPAEAAQDIAVALPHPLMPEPFVMPSPPAGRLVLAVEVPKAAPAPRPVAAASAPVPVAVAACPAGTTGSPGRCVALAPPPTVVAALEAPEPAEEAYIEGVGKPPQLRVETAASDPPDVVVRKLNCVGVASESERCDALEGVDDRLHLLCYETLDERISACLEGRPMPALIYRN